MAFILVSCRRLGNFVKLVDQMIVEHMFHVTKTQVTMFVSTVLVTGQSPLRDGFFKANLVFTKHGRYCYVHLRHFLLDLILFLVSWQ